MRRIVLEVAVAATLIVCALFAGFAEGNAPASTADQRGHVVFGLVAKNHQTGAFIGAYRSKTIFSSISECRRVAESNDFAERTANLAQMIRLMYGTDTVVVGDCADIDASPTVVSGSDSLP